MSKETWNTFQARLGNFSEEQIKEIDTAYQIAKAAHRGQARDGGERYFEHPRSIALILLDELNINNHKLIIAAFLHDAPEDTAVFGNSQKIKPYSQWQNQVKERLENIFDEDVSEMVLAVTKPEVDGVEIISKQQALNLYKQQLNDASPEAILLKMADRLHNLRTLESCSMEKRVRKIKETKDVYFDIFQKAFEKYPKEATYLFDQMLTVINSLSC